MYKLTRVLEGNTKMTKEQEFLQFVQTIIITNGINVSLNDDAKKIRHNISQDKR